MRSSAEAPPSSHTIGSTVSSIAGLSLFAHVSRLTSTTSVTSVTSGGTRTSASYGETLPRLVRLETIHVSHVSRQHSFTSDTSRMTLSRDTLTLVTSIMSASTLSHQLRLQ